jgi:CheY-like chemotaxis protein
MQQEQFGALLRHLLANLHDYVVLEKHPLNELFPRIDASLSRAEHLRRTVAAAIESLKPQHLRFDVSATEWRYYLILHGRYIEGANLSELQNQLALGDRQERRIHMRALDLLQAVLYEQMAGAAVLRQPIALDPDLAVTAEGPFPTPGQDDEQESEADENGGFQIVLESLNLQRVLDEVIYLCEPRLRACGAQIQLEIPGDLPPVQADRIILRQILLHLVNTVLLSHRGQGEGGEALSAAITIAARPHAAAICLTIEWQTQGGRDELPHLAEQAPLRYWLEQLHMYLDSDRVQAISTDHAQPKRRLILVLPAASQTTLMVVDDHESAIRIIQRFLQSTAIRVMGETEPARVMEVVRTRRPQAILLDVMMPTTDGWELLQRLKADPETAGIPVVVCSVWSVPELALSLGANGFLKKPIDRDHLLETLLPLLAPAVLPMRESRAHD